MSSERSASESDAPLRWRIIAELQRADFRRAAHGLIVGVAVTQAGQRQRAVAASGGRMEDRLKKKPQQMVADGGYTTRDNIEKMAEREIDFLGSMGRKRCQAGRPAPASASAQRVCLPSARRIAMFARKASCCGRKGVTQQEETGLMAYWYEAEFSDCQACAPQAPVLSGKSEARPIGGCGG